MLKRNSTLALTGLVLHLLLCLPPPVAAQSSGEPQLVEKIKADVTSIGVGAQVSVKLRDKKKLTGYISKIGEKDFVVAEAKEGAEQTVAYADVTQLKQKNEKRVSKGVKILIGFGVLWAFAMIVTGGGG